jgi:hypothetical protein
MKQLLVTQSSHGMNSCRAPSGYIASRECYGTQHDSHDCKCTCIVGPNSEEHVAQESGQGYRTGKTNHETDESETQSLQENLAKNHAFVCAQSHANAYFMGALPRGV